MAEITKTATLRTVIDSSGAEKGSDRTVGATKRAAKGADKLTGSFDKLKLAALALAGGFAVFKALSNTIAITRTFTSAISDLSAITGASGKDLKFLSDAAREFGSTTTLSASQAAEAFKLVASAKPDLLENADALKSVTKQAILLAEASGSTLTEAANTVGNSLNQFGAEADQAARFVNVLAAGSKYGASEIGSTSRALKEAGTTAKAVGLSFEQTNAAIQVLASVGLKGSQAGTQLKSVLLKLSASADDTINPSIVGMATAFENLREKQLSIPELTKLIGLESFGAAKAFIENAEALGTMTTKLTGTATAMEQAKVKVDNLDGDMKKLNSAWEELNLVVGLSTDSLARGFIQAVTSVVLILPTMSKALEDANKSFLSFITGKDLSKPFAKIPDAVDDVESLTKKIVLMESQIERAIKTASGIDLSFMRKQLESLKIKLNVETNYEDLIKQIGIGSEIKLSTDKATEELFKFKDNVDATVPTRIEFEVAEEKAFVGARVDPNLLRSREEQNLKQIEMAESLILTEEQRLLESMLRRDAIISNANLSEEKTNSLKLKNAAKYYADSEKMAKKSEDAKSKLAWQSAGNIASSLTYATSVFAKEGKVAFAIHKAVSIAQASISTYRAVAAALPNYPLAAAVGLAGAAQIYKIKSTSFSGGGASAASLSPSGVSDTSINQPPATQQLQQENKQPPKQIIINISGYTNSDVVRNDILPMVKEVLGEDDEILFDEDSRQAQILRAG